MRQIVPRGAALVAATQMKRAFRQMGTVTRRGVMGKGIAAAVLGAAFAVVATGAWAQRVDGVCVGTSAGCLPTIEAGLNASHDGDTIRVERGTFHGGLTIDKNVALVGAGAGVTIVEGGGPVLTIAGGSGRIVSIVGITVKGGITSANQTGRCGADVPTCGPHYLEATALGGGIEIIPGSGSTAGATVSIRNSVVTGNRAEPSITAPSVTAQCPAGPCAFAQAGGGGIDNWGTLTLTGTTVSSNIAGGGVTAQANGGGILGEPGSRLTLVNSTVKGNRVTVSVPNGRFANGGGIYDQSGTVLDVRRSTISGNRSEATLAMPASVDVNVACAGVCIGDDTIATIRESAISSNTTMGSNTAGNGVFCSGGVATGGGGSFTLSHSTVSGNRVVAKARATSSRSGDFLACSAALDLFAAKVRITNTRVVGNAVSATTLRGAALVVGGAISTVTADAVITRSVFSGNSATAKSGNGSATVYGGAIANGGTLRLSGSKVTSNLARARARTSVARGGGIYSGRIPDVDGLAGLTVTRTVVARNMPEQCFGCR